MAAPPIPAVRVVIGDKQTQRQIDTFVYGWHNRQREVLVAPVLQQGETLKWVGPNNTPTIVRSK